jgi:hypothetical protein
MYYFRIEVVVTCIIGPVILWCPVLGDHAGCPFIEFVRSCRQLVRAPSCKRRGSAVSNCRADETTLRRFVRCRTFLLWIEAAKQTVDFPVRSGGEIKRLQPPTIGIVAELETPKSIDDYGSAIRGTRQMYDMATTSDYTSKWLTSASAQHLSLLTRLGLFGFGILSSSHGRGTVFDLLSFSGCPTCLDLPFGFRDAPCSSFQMDEAQ